jgi:Flp pilus assembly protein TadG
MHMSGRSLYRDERGMSLVFVGIGFLGFVAATMLAIDVGMLMTARSEAQNSADAGAHAGAVALAFDDYNDRSTSGPAVTNAIARAKANLVMSAAVDVDPDDVEFLPGSFGEINRVKVTVYRTAGRGNPVGLLMAPIFGMTSTDIGATATAEASPANAMDCMLPFMIPDRWNERTSPPFHSVDSTFAIFDNKGNPINPADQYIDANQDDYTGYDPVRDRGTKIVLKAGVDTTVSPSIFNPIVVPGNGTGADEYRNAIANCAHAEFKWDQPITVEPGNMTGPTKQGIEELVAKDPNAVWDEGCLCVKNSDFPISPRIRPIPLYDPDFYERGKQTGRNADFKVANFLGVFVDGMQGNEVIAYITPIAGGTGSSAGPAPKNAFPYVIRIVE